MLTGDDTSLLFIFFICSAMVAVVSSHGRLISPPSRASMWRYGFDNPADYNDNQGFCGGVSVQWKQNDGKCGICGDPWQGPRLHEPGQDNVYANGIIVEQYRKGQAIDVQIQLTAHHKGYFEFRMCPSNNPNKAVTHSCLNRFLLRVENENTDQSKTRFLLPPPKNATNTYVVKLLLPVGLVCTHCVMQWKYNTGNSWGCDETGKCAVGLGEQEQFYACADVSINGDSSVVTSPATQMNKNATTPTSRITDAPTMTTTNAIDTTTIASSTSTENMDSKTETIKTVGTSPAEHSTTRATTSPSSPPLCNASTPCVYKSAGPWKGQKAMDQWCLNHCPGNACSLEHCACVSPCAVPTPKPTCAYRATGPWKGQRSMDNWCSVHCPGGSCSLVHCKCVDFK